MSPHDPARPPADGLTVPLVAESADVRKVAVDRGGYRVHKSTETRVELIDALLARSEVHVERRAVGSELPDGVVPQTRYEGDTLVVPVLKEVLVAVKRTVLVEEVRITRVDSAERHRERVPLREERVEIERLEAGDTRAAEP